MQDVIYRMLHKGVRSADSLTSSRCTYIHIVARIMSRNVSAFVSGASDSELIHLTFALSTHGLSTYRFTVKIQMCLVPIKKAGKAVQCTYSAGLGELHIARFIKAKFTEIRQ
jgi:hypothetical protein